jgi:hypothetical protein
MISRTSEASTIIPGMNDSISSGFSLSSRFTLMLIYVLDEQLICIYNWRRQFLRRANCVGDDVCARAADVDSRSSWPNDFSINNAIPAIVSHSRECKKKQSKIGATVRFDAQDSSREIPSRIIRTSPAHSFYSCLSNSFTFFHSRAIYIILDLGVKLN